jgi:TPR repeat protein
MSIEKGCSIAMNNLANYYRYYEQKNNHALIVKYYLMAIEKGYDDAINNLASYYESKGKYNEMIKSTKGYI